MNCPACKTPNPIFFLSPVKAKPWTFWCRNKECKSSSAESIGVRKFCYKTKAILMKVLNRA